jgi:hypothetical protein
MYGIYDVIFFIRVNERRYEFGDEKGATHWVCAKVPNNGIVKKDCVPKVGSLYGEKSVFQFDLPFTRCKDGILEDFARDCR